jgi:nucleotide-binding universal stress UspA family protein
VLHVREVSRLSTALTLEAPDEAHALVEQAVSSLGLAGVAAEGRVRTLPEDRVAQGIVEESSVYGCDAIVVGSRRLRGISRVSGRGVRERILGSSPLPVIVAPGPLHARNIDSRRLKSSERYDLVRSLDADS